MGKTETLEEYLARGGKISYPKPIYPIVLKTTITVFTGRKKPTPPHGTRQRYNSDKCRCDLCREAHKIYAREYNRQRNNVKKHYNKGEK